ncbi:GNAT family N-acetyltransferase [Galactobacter caseinivorans]|uniref:GNAT family N-acetyltransferase n=1 Tax=Galactobacter caseinivorans TaxID=2676123 RepID=A0A496PJW7_9MICC|nr:GNAT family N-acetyltransferase [Galactobacter caseinivorans]RKW70720.1 GNAT family N-acetyltransferase [Galactobacter caseinivorans]
MADLQGITFRAWEDGDDLRLLEVWGGPRTPQAHEDRTMLRVSSDEPFARSVVAEDQGVPFAAAVVYSSSLHPQRYWFYAEVASGLRRRGIATELLRLLRLELPAGAQLKARYTVAAAGENPDADGAAGFLRAAGFGELQRSRLVVVEPGSLPLPAFSEDGLTLDEAATGSVELSTLVAGYYNATHEWDPSLMSVGLTQTMLLGDHTGAKGAVVLRDRPKAAGGRILAFAVSYEPQRPEAPTEVFLGWDPELGLQDATLSVRSLLGMLVHQFPVQLEVDDAMVPLALVIDELGAAELATVVATSEIVATDA